MSMDIAQELSTIKNDLYQISCEVRLKPPHKYMFEDVVKKLDDLETRVLKKLVGNIE